MRDLHPDFAAAIQGRQITPALLVYLDVLGDPLRCWTGLGPLEWSGHTWLGFGALAGVDPIEEYSEIRAGELTLTLTHVPGTALSGLPALSYKRRAAEIHLALLDGDTANILGVELLFRGAIDHLTIERGPENSTLKLALTNELARLRDTWGLLYTDTHQRSLYPSDTALRFIPGLQDFRIKF